MDVIDLIAYANENKPVDFTKTVNDILQQKATDAVDEFKKEVASNMFGDGEETETEDEVETDDELEFDDEELEQMLDDAEVEYDEDAEDSEEDYEDIDDDEYEEQEENDE